MRNRQRSGRNGPIRNLVAVGLVAMFSFQVCENVGMTMGIMPITGIPLPFLSYGGSFTMINFISLGIILGVDIRRYVNR